MKCTLYVMDGRVGCPRRGDIDVDICSMCPDLSDIRRQGDQTFVVCKPQRQPVWAVPYGPLGR